MFKRPGLRLSLFSLLLLLTLAAVSVSHWQTSHELDLRDAEIRELRQQVRERNDQLGILTVHDPSQVHVIATDRRYEGERKDRRGPRAVAWEVYLPPNHLWELCWAFGNVAYATDAPDASILLDPGDHDPHTLLEIEFVRPTGEWEIRVKCFEKVCAKRIPEQGLAFVQDRVMNRCIMAGDNSRAGTLTESFDADQPIVLLQQYRRSSKPIPNDGIVVWLQARDSGRAPATGF